MPYKKHLSEKEKTLLEGIINKEEASEKEFDRLFRQKIFKIVMGFTNSQTDAEDITQEIFIKLLDRIRKHEIKQNLNGWIVKVTKNYCIDVYRIEHTKKALKFAQPLANYNKGTALIDISEDIEAIAPGSKEFYEKDKASNININTLYKIKELEFSIKQVELFYKLIKDIKSNPTSYERILKVKKILISAQKKIEKIVGHISKRKIERYHRLRATLCLSNPEKRELKKLKNQEFIISINENLNELIARMNSTVNTMVQQDFLSTIIDKSSHSMYYHGEYYFYFLFDFALKLRTMKIKPPRLMFSVWAKDLKKGKNVDLRKIKFILSYFKRKTKGTEKEFLFDSIDENLSTFDSIRKSQYKKTPKEKLYKELVDFMYKYSFRPEQLHLFPGEWIK